MEMLTVLAALWLLACIHVVCAISFDSTGRLLQLEYALKAVENGGDVVAVKGQDGIVLLTAAVPCGHSSLRNAFASSKVKRISTSSYFVASGLVADVRYLEDIAYQHSASHISVFGCTPPIAAAADHIAALVHRRTLTASDRPIGAACCLLAHSEDKGFQLVEVDPTGNWHNCEAVCFGSRVRGLLAAWQSARHAHPADPVLPTNAMPCEQIAADVLKYWSDHLKEAGIALEEVDYQLQVLRAGNVLQAIQTEVE